MAEHTNTGEDTPHRDTQAFPQSQKQILRPQDHMGVLGQIRGGGHVSMLPVEANVPSDQAALTDVDACPSETFPAPAFFTCSGSSSSSNSRL